MNINEFKEKIEKLKKEKNAFIMAHYYQLPEIQEVADFIGDSLELSRKAANLKEDIIVFCGVRFMGETAKILAPDKKVLTPYINSGCLLADMSDAEELKKFKQKHRDYTVVSYVNTYAEIKAESDIICTSANAKKIVENVKGKKIVFIPDRNLGRYCTQGINKKVFLWNGYCPVHEKITLNSIERVKEKNKDAIIAVHPECPPEVTEKADFVGSTSQLINFVQNSKYKKFIIGTEKDTLYVMRQKAPDKILLLPDPVPICDQMKMITPERLLKCLEDEIFEITVEPHIADKARKAIEKMLEL